MAQTLATSPNEPTPSPSLPAEEVHLLQEYCGNLIKGLLKECGIPYQIGELDENLIKATCDAAAKQGCCVSGPFSIVPFIRMGSVMGSVTYVHREFDIKVFISLYSACLFYMDDKGARDTSLSYDFVENFALGRAQKDPVMETFAGLLREMPEKFGQAAATIMITSGMNMVSALLFEENLTHMPLRPTVAPFASLVREMSGGADPYVCFMFPRDLPHTSYIHAVPYIRTFINLGNDVLSFYKEELRGECANHVSTIAASTGTSKRAVLEDFVKETAAAYKGALESLSSDPKALELFRNFGGDYVSFHTTMDRYKLAELNLE